MAAWPPALTRGARCDRQPPSRSVALPPYLSRLSTSRRISHGPPVTPFQSPFSQSRVESTDNTAGEGGSLSSEEEAGTKSEINRAPSPISHCEKPAADAQWIQTVELHLIPHPKLRHKAAVEADYGMRAGVLKVRCRAAVAGYALRRWGGGLFVESQSPRVRVPARLSEPRIATWDR